VQIGLVGAAAMPGVVRPARRMALRIPADCMRSLPYEFGALADQDRARGNPLYKLPCLRKTRPMTGADEKQTLHRYLRNARGVLLWKLEGLSDYDIRRPVTPTGTNLLGLVKHCAGVECGYFGAVMGRPFPGEDDLDWHEGDDDELSGDMYATAAESREQVTDFYRRVQAHSDATIGELPLDACGTVPWWPEERRHPTLHTLLVHTIQETARHAGHADIIRESIDGAAGLREGVSNMPAEAGAAAWKQHYDKVDQIARSTR
jgi:uncharacterized damage-inducible protein DinB